MPIIIDRNRDTKVKQSRAASIALRKRMRLTAGTFFLVVAVALAFMLPDRLGAAGAAAVLGITLILNSWFLEPFEP